MLHWVYFMNGLFGLIFEIIKLNVSLSIFEVVEHRF